MSQHWWTKMATSKKYAYYIKGNQLALIQKETQAATVAGDFNEEFGMYKSPIEAVANGIEFQYTYVNTVIGDTPDENTDLPLTRYQANALVYYLKAKAAEDIGDLDQREYFMREFKRQLGKAESALRGGIRIAQGFKGMRRK